MREKSLEYGECISCERVLPVCDSRGEKVLEQVLFYIGHLHKGSHHHKLLCRSCRKKADEAFS